MAAPVLDQVEKISSTKGGSMAVQERNRMREWAREMEQKNAERVASEKPAEQVVAQETPPEVKTTDETVKTAEQTVQTPTEEKKVEAAKPEKKIPYTKIKEREAEEAKRIAAEAQAKLQEYEQKTQTYEQKVAELEKQIAETDSKKETEALQAKLAEVEKFRESLVNENAELKKQNEIELGMKSPVFQEKWVKPVAETYNAMVKTVGDATLASEIEKIRLASDAALTATTPEDRAHHETVRDEIFSSLYDQLPPFKQSRLNDLYYSFLNRNEELQGAIRGGYETAKQVKEEEFRRAQEAQTRLKSTWNGSFEKNIQSLQEQTKYSEDIANTIKLKGIADSTDEDLAIAQDLLQTGNTFKFTPEDHTRVIAQGVTAKRLQATVEAQKAIIAELNETIGRYKGTSTAGSASPNSQPIIKNGVDESTGLSKDGKIRTAADMLARFGTHKASQ